MQWHVKRFDELSLTELYQILKVRVDVFVVEQECPYPEIDGIDPNCVHLFLKDQNEIVTYARLVPKGILEPYPMIGRIIVNQKYRKSGYGRALLNQAISIITTEWKEDAIKLQGQTYLQAFYQSLGFEAVSDPYLEDGIPHIDMIRKNNPTHP